MKAISYIILLILVSPISTSAGFFGPSNYDECVLENMKGVTSDQAALAIQRACRSKFPVSTKKEIIINKNEFPGFPFNEDTSAAHKLLNRYIMEYDEIKIYYKTPEDYVFALFDNARKKNPNRKYGEWINDHNINFFINKAQEFDNYMNGNKP